MNHHIFELLRGAVVHYGYWAVAAVVVAGECRRAFAGGNDSVAGQLPGLFRTRIAASLDHCGRDRGDDGGRRVGFCAGAPRRASADRTLPGCLLHSRGELARGERLFDRYGAATVFLARFLFGMRVLASLLAGALHMPWRKFALFNFLGAAVWVTAICGAGYLFGGHWGRLAHDLKRFDLAVAIVVRGGAGVVVAKPEWPGRSLSDDGRAPSCYHFEISFEMSTLRVNLCTGGFCRSATILSECRGRADAKGIRGH